ncbi:MAG: 2-C-methyl-D-erythritol 4-phosphate cytidylyltransferase [Candidatus Hydrogenedentota bacterium]
MDDFPQLILVAGGLGTRLGQSEPKALTTLAGKVLFIRSLDAFIDAALLDKAIVVYPVGHESAFRSTLDGAYPDNTVQLVRGGIERNDSVRNGLAALDPRTTLVVIHDAARPFIPASVIGQALSAALTVGAATVATPCKDTILKSTAEYSLEATPNRNTLWACQTPQIFQRSIIDGAYASPIPSTITDDATLVQQAGHEVRIIEGPDTNMKITTPQDLAYAEFLLEKGLV